MEQFTEKQRDFLELGKRMREVIELSRNLTGDGHPIVDKWVNDVEEIVQKHSASHMLMSLWSYQSHPQRNVLFDILTYLRRVLKEEGVFSQELVE